MEGSDTDAYDSGAVSVTPLVLDLFASAGAGRRLVERARGRGTPGIGGPCAPGVIKVLAIHGSPQAVRSRHENAFGPSAPGTDAPRRRHGRLAAPATAALKRSASAAPTTTDPLKYARSLIRDVPNFPHAGILFRDITPLLADPRAFHITLDAMAERFVGEHADAIVAVESRGFIFGGALAARLNASFVPVRKPGKLPARTDRVHYALEYGEGELEMHRKTRSPAARASSS